jgi:hypothetical protein
MIFSKKEKPKTVAQEPGAGGEETESTVCDEFMGSLKIICNKGKFLRCKYGRVFSESS